MNNDELNTISNNTSDSSAIGIDVIAREQISEKRDVLTIDLPDAVFIKVANAIRKRSKEVWDKKYHLTERRAKNEKYLFGRQLDDEKRKRYEGEYIDNIIYEAESYIKPMGLSRFPDIVTHPGNDTPESKESSESLSKIVTTDIQSRDRRRVLALAFKHLPVGFLGAIKTFWNPEKGKYGDYDFKVVHYNNLVLDYTATSNDAKDMQFVAEAIEYSVKEWVMRFPKKEKEFYAELREMGVFNTDLNENTEAGMNTKVKGWETWFTYYDKNKDGTYERLECVGWHYGNCLLGKMKDPNWDWEGDAITFKYDQAATEDDLKKALTTQDVEGLQQKRVFHNHLENPEKPYIFLGYDQWGVTPIDETSRIEQSILMQFNLDQRGKQIGDMLAGARGKNVWSAMEGLKAEDVEEMDPNDPDEDMIVKGDVNKVHTHIAGVLPPPQMIQDKNEMRERIFDKMGVHGPARGEVDQGAPATNNQISREGDFTRNDDLVEDTINYAAEKMANWILQFIKLRYTEDHFKRILGANGQMLFKKINRDMIEDGMEVSISASGTDKLKAEQRAMDMAKLELVDPLQFYTDMHMSDPKERTVKLALWTDPNLRMMYLQKYCDFQPAQAMSGALNAQTPGGQQPNQPAQQSGQAMADIAQIQKGQVPPPPQQLDPGYAQTFAAFMQDPQGAQAVLQQFPQIKEQLLQFAQAVSMLAKQGASQAPAPTGQPMSGAPQSAGPDKVPPRAGPISQNPSPTNTSVVATGGPQSMV